LLLVLELAAMDFRRSAGGACAGLVVESGGGGCGNSVDEILGGGSAMPLALHAYYFVADDEPPEFELVFYGDDLAEAEDKMEAFLVEHPSLKAHEKDFVLEDFILDESDVPESQDFEPEEEESEEEEEVEGQ
jgi:hypothetical protein